MICKHILPKYETQRWMRESLQEGPSLLFSKMVDNVWKWSQSKFFTFGRDDLNASNLLDFKTGGVIGDADEFIMNYAKNKYHKKNMLFFIEDWTVDRASIHLLNTNIHYISQNNDIYNFIEINDKLSIKKFITAFYNLPAALHVYIIPNYGDFFCGMNITEGRLMEISKDVKEIICGAYDGEGYVVANIED